MLMSKSRTTERLNGGKQSGSCHSWGYNTTAHAPFVLLVIYGCNLTWRHAGLRLIKFDAKFTTWMILSPSWKEPLAQHTICRSWLTHKLTTHGTAVILCRICTLARMGLFVAGASPSHIHLNPRVFKLRTSSRLEQLKKTRMLVPQQKKCYTHEAGTTDNSFVSGSFLATIILSGIPGIRAFCPMV